MTTFGLLTEYSGTASAGEVAWRAFTLDATTNQIEGEGSPAALRPGKLHFFKLVAVNAAGSSEFSDEASAALAPLPAVLTPPPSYSSHPWVVEA